MAAKQTEKVPIRPGVGILSALSRLNYKPWFAIAEFVDNSVQSYLDNQTLLKKRHGKNFKLIVDIEYTQTDGGKLVIRDNAGGISRSEFKRAFRPAELPPSTTGLHEYGMGMKSAACWFAPKWSVRTSAVGDPNIRTVKFDIAKIVHDNIEELDVLVAPGPKDGHFTEITLTSLHRPPQTKTVTKIKEHLASIYREYLREGLIEINFGKPVIYEEPPVLKAPSYKNPKGKQIEWKEELSLSLGGKRCVHGWVGLRAKGIVAGAGFALFRKKRLIQGSADEGYRPEQIFGKPNSFYSQRVFGELHLEGFDVTHTKDGFVWEEHESEFVDHLERALTKCKLPILTQAERHSYRDKAPREQMQKIVKQEVASIGKSLPQVKVKSLFKKPLAQSTPKTKLPAAKDKISSETFSMNFRDQRWEITVELTYDAAIGDLLTLSESTEKKGSSRKLTVRVGLGNAFVDEYIAGDQRSLRLLVRLLSNLAIAEAAAREGGVTYAGRVRQNLNELIAASDAAGGKRE